MTTQNADAVSPADVQAKAWDQLTAIFALIQHAHEPEGFTVSHEVLNNALWAASDIADRGAAAFDAEQRAR